VEALSKLVYGERFRHFMQDCPGAFRSLKKLALQNLWFDDPTGVNNLVRGCHALQHRLSLTSCGLFPKTVLQAMDNDDEPPRLPMLTIDAPQSRLQVLVCEFCYIGGVELVQAPKLASRQALVQRRAPSSRFQGSSPADLVWLRSIAATLACDYVRSRSSTALWSSS
jgi:hypothetical protein